MNNIKKYRLQFGMKQIELCNILGVSQGALSGWENGRYEPDIKSMNKMAEIFNITVDELLGRNIETVPPTNPHGILVYRGKVNMDNLKKIRLKSGYSQKDFAKLIHVPPNTYNQWENGTREPDYEMISRIADYFNVTVDYLLGREQDSQNENNSKNKGIKIPVLGYIPAGIPIEAVEDILDYEEITPDMARNGEHFALKIKGDSMIPNIMDGDIVIVRVQPDVESGETAIVKVNGDEATCKRIVKQKTGISIVANNPKYEPRFFTNEEVINTPVTVVGKVVELRRSF